MATDTPFAMGQKKNRPGSALPIKKPKRSSRWVITKIDVAVRQLEDAIYLWAANGDFVSVLTLGHAAHRILFHLNEGLSNPCINLGDKNPWGIDEPWVKDWPVMFRMGYDFSRHGGKNPKELHRYDPELPIFVIHDAIRIYHHLGFPMRSVFEAWFKWIVLTRPKFFGKKLSDFGISQRIATDAIRCGRQKFIQQAKAPPGFYYLPRGMSVFHARAKKYGIRLNHDVSAFAHPIRDSN